MAEKIFAGRVLLVSVAVILVMSLFSIFSTAIAEESILGESDTNDQMGNGVSAEETTEGSTEEASPELDGSITEPGVTEPGVEANIKDVEKRITREKAIISGGAIPEFDQVIVTEDGNEYNLVYIDNPVDDSTYVPYIKKYEQKKTKDVPIKDINNLEKYFSKSINIKDGYYVGKISLAPNPFSKVEVYESFTGQVDKTHIIEDLPDNDVSRLPKKKTFEVSSDEYYGATKSAVLKLLSVEYEVTGTNSLGLPNKYTAHLTFRGQQSWLEPHHYSVTAKYEGEVVSSEQRRVVEAHYELVSVDPVISEPVIEEVPDIQPPTVPTVINVVEPPEEPTNIFPAIASAGIVIISAIGLILFWLLYWIKNAVLIKTLNTTVKVIARKRLEVIDGQATFKVPDHVEVFDEAIYEIKLKPSLANKEGVLVVEWRGVVIATEALKRKIQIGRSIITDEAVLAAITEEILDMEGLIVEPS